MWIIPSNHPLYSAFAQEFVASKEDLSEQSALLESRLMWKTKPSLLPTWLQRWNRVFWLPHLFGRMLKPSRYASFETAYMQSLAVIPVPPSALSESRPASSTLTTSGRTSKMPLMQLDLFGAGSKTSSTTSISDTKPLGMPFKDWVMLLGKEYTLRLKQARPTDANDCSSWPYEWTTASARDFKDTPGMSQERGGGKNRIDQLARQVYYVEAGQLDPTNSNSRMKIKGLLNPSWVAQLMGTTSERIFFEHWVTVSSNKPPK